MSRSIFWALRDFENPAFMFLGRLPGFNLPHGRHVEFSPGDEIRRSVCLEMRLRF